MPRLGSLPMFRPATGISSHSNHNSADTNHLLLRPRSSASSSSDAGAGDNNKISNNKIKSQRRQRLQTRLNHLVEKQAKKLLQRKLSKVVVERTKKKQVKFEQHNKKKQATMTTTKKAPLVFLADKDLPRVRLASRRRLLVPSTANTAAAAIAPRTEIIEFDCSGVKFRADKKTVQPILDAKAPDGKPLALDLGATSFSPSGTVVRGFFVDREPESFALLLLALRRCRFIDESVVPRAKAVVAGGSSKKPVEDASPRRGISTFAATTASSSSSSAAVAPLNPRFAKFPAETEQQLFEEATFFSCLPSVWQSLSVFALQRCLPRPMPLASTGLRDEGRALGGQTVAALASPFLSARGCSAASGHSAQSTVVASALEAAFRIEDDHYVGIGVVTRAAAQQLDQEFYKEPGCACLYMSGVIHSNFFGRNRRFETDATFSTGDVVSIRVDFRANLIQWRKFEDKDEVASKNADATVVVRDCGTIILTERFLPPPEFGMGGEMSWKPEPEAWLPGDLAIAVVVKRQGKIRVVNLMMAPA